MVNFSFWGTCTTRDIVSIGSLGYKPTSFISFISPLTYLFPKMNRIKQSELGWGSPWYQKNLMYDLNGDLEQILKEGQGDFLLLNLNTIRYGIILFENSHGELTSCTHSMPYKNNKDILLGKDKFRQLIRYDQNGIGLLNASFKWFTEVLSEIYPAERIILLENYMCKKYLTKQGNIQAFGKPDLTERQNNKIAYWNKLFKQYLPECHVLSSSKEYIADENHKWGKGQTHYVYDYYRDMAAKVSDIVR